MADERKNLFDVLTQEMRLRNYSLKIIKAYKSCIHGFVRLILPLVYVPAC
jgi:hypothetical protein